MKHVMQKIINLPFTKKIILIVLSVILFIVTMSFVGVSYIMKANNKLLYESLAASLSYSSKEIASNLNVIETVSTVMLSDDIIQSELSGLKASSDTQLRRYTYQQLYASVQSYYNQFKYNYITWMSIYNDYFVSHSYQNLAEQTPEEVRTDLIKRGQAGDGAIVWINDYVSDYGLFLVRSIRQIKNLRLDNIGTLLICVDFDHLMEASTVYNTQYEHPYYLIFSGDQLIYHSDSINENSLIKINEVMDEPYGVITLDNNKYFAVRCEITGFDLSYICLISYNSISRSIYMSNILYVLFTCAVAALAVIFSRLVIQSVMKHFNTLILKMKAFRGQESEIITVGYDYSKRNDEFGLLHQQFDSMAMEIKNLINEKYITEILMRDAQLKALETQINPHFLYNTLESVNWRAKAIGERDISTMVESLGNLLRMTLSNKKNNMFTLGEELELVTYYISIQKCRFEERLSYSQNCDRSLYNALIPKLCIQPLVENSIHYALEEITEICYIDLTIQKNQEELDIYVTNNGSLFEDDLLDKLTKKQTDPHGFGIGLLNINQRLKLTFGETYGLSLYNEDEHAVAKITIPYQPITNTQGEGQC